MPMRVQISPSAPGIMKPRYFKYYWGAGRNFDWYRICPDGKVERQKCLLSKTHGKWYIVKDGTFSTLMESKLEEISEEDYFLDLI